MSLRFFPVLCHQSPRLLPCTLLLSPDQYIFSLQTNWSKPLQNSVLRWHRRSGDEVKAAAGGAAVCSLSAEKKLDLSSGSESSAAVAMRQGKVFGSWKSPITADLVSGASLKLGGKTLDCHAHLVVEGRPSGSGRYVIVRAGSEAGANPVDITSPNFNIHIRLVHAGPSLM